MFGVSYHYISTGKLLTSLFSHTPHVVGNDLPDNKVLLPPGLTRCRLS